MGSARGCAGPYRALPQRTAGIIEERITTPHASACARANASLAARVTAGSLARQNPHPATATERSMSIAVIVIPALAILRMTPFN